MKKIFSFALAVIILLSIAFSCFPNNSSAAQPIAKVENFTCDTFGQPVGKNGYALFTAKISSAAKDEVVQLYSGNSMVAIMSDNGSKASGDKVLGDGIYTARIPIYSSVKATESFSVKVSGFSCGFKHDIKFYNSVSDNQWLMAKALWQKIYSIEDTFSVMNKSLNETFSAVASYIRSSSIVSSVTQNKHSVSFEFDSGIKSVYSFENNLCKNAAQRNSEKFLSDCKQMTYNYVDSDKIGVWSPFYGLDENFSMCYQDAANSFAEALEYDSVDAYYGEEATIESFKSFDEYGLILIDSHGVDENGGGYICIPNPGEYDENDILEGHLVYAGDSVYLTGSFFEKYCDTLKNPIVYIGICHGMAADNLYAPLIRHGAGFVCGYTDSVSFEYDNAIMETFIASLASVNPETEVLFTAGEAYSYTKEVNGEIDPYGDAKLIFVGNDALSADRKIISVESFSLSKTEVTLYINNEFLLFPIIEPKEANRYTYEFTSSAPEICTCSESGIVTALASGKAEITCLLKDNSMEFEREFIAKCIVTVDGEMNVYGIQLQNKAFVLYTNGIEKTIEATVFPSNASNKELSYRVGDNKIAKVSKKGVISAVAAGYTYVEVKTKDGDYNMFATITVLEGNEKNALNAENGALALKADENWECTTYGGRFCMKSTNHTDFTKSDITLTVDLPEGAILTFDRNVSSEDNWDSMLFTVNKKFIEEIGSINGEYGEEDWISESYTVSEAGTYEFMWSYLKDEIDSAGNDCAYLDNVDIIIPETVHKVIFVGFGEGGGEENVLAANEVLHGDRIEPPKAPEVEGYSFLCWDTPFTEIRSDITVSAVYIDDARFTVLYSVTYLDYDGTIISVQTTYPGKQMTPPVPPERAGYVFMGWNGDVFAINCDTVLTALYLISGDVNFSGDIDTADVVFILRLSILPYDLSDYLLRLADSNCDGIINSGDAVCLLKKIVGE